MTVVDGRKAISAEIAAIVDRRQPAAGPRRSWASTEPFAAGPQVALEGDEGVTWRAAASRYVRNAVVTETVAAGVSIGLAVWFRGWWGPDVAFSVFALAVSFLVAIALGHGYDPRVVGDGPREIQAVLRAGVVAAVVPAVGAAFLRLPLERTIVLAGAVILAAHSVVARHGLRRRLHHARGAGMATARTLVVGDADSVHRIVEQLRVRTHHGYRVVGICLPSVRDTPPQDGVPMLGAIADTVQVAHDYRIETVIVAGSELAGDALRRLTWALGHVGTGLVVIVKFGVVAFVSPRLFPVVLPSPSAQARQSSGRQRPVCLGRGDPASGAQHGAGAGEFVGWGADVHAGVVENEIFEVDQLAFEPQAGRGIGIMCARDPAIADRAFCQPLVKAGERIFGSGERAGERRSARLWLTSWSNRLDACPIWTWLALV